MPVEPILCTIAIYKAQVSHTSYLRHCIAMLGELIKFYTATIFTEIMLLNVYLRKR